MATAARLAKAGWKVTVVEKNSFTGGRCSLIHHNGYVSHASAWIEPSLSGFCTLIITAIRSRALSPPTASYVSRSFLGPRNLDGSGRRPTCQIGTKLQVAFP